MSVNSRMRNADDDDVPVTWDDQRAINRFGRLNNLFHEVEDRLKEIEGELQKLEDGNDELILADDDDLIMYSFGEIFFSLPKSETEELMERSAQTLKNEQQALQAKMNDIQEETKQLKVKLYAKFGKNIYLEEE
eukprot:c2121_g1_i1.p1 GENE.c2121_g1_i1~~c2121_g1_i1.p1  ORF type:complete len:146 (-),score=35.20 c2121_g1_i1:49-450(-)